MLLSYQKIQITCDVDKVCFRLFGEYNLIRSMIFALLLPLAYGVYKTLAT